jgi:dTMP kinase
MTLADHRKPRGYYIVVEGDEGSGKTTQVQHLARYLESTGQKVVIVQEPGGSPFGRELRVLLKDPQYKITPAAEFFAFLSQRAELLVTEVQQHLAAGTWVLSDRSSTSTLVYQGYGRGMNDSKSKYYFPDFQLILNSVAKLASVDLTVILDVPPEQSASRIQQRVRGGGEAPDRFETSSPEFRQAVNDGYRQAARLPKHGIVDGIGTEEEVAKRVREMVDDWRHAIAGFRETWNPGKPFYGITCTQTTREEHS